MQRFWSRSPPRPRPLPPKDRHLASLDANGNLDSLIARHAAANNLPADLLRRVIRRESGGNPRVVYKGNYGLMQIKLATARSMGYRGDAAGLLDADTNMTYAAKYLAGAYRVAGGNPDRAVHYYAAGYYYAAKREDRAARGSGNHRHRVCICGRRPCDRPEPGAGRLAWLAEFRRRPRLATARAASAGWRWPCAAACSSVPRTSSGKNRAARVVSA